MANKISVPRGTCDILPDQAGSWQRIEQQARGILGTYGYKEIRTPFFEETKLFARSVGEETDIVSKQMLQLLSQKKGDADDIKSELSLRPEGTASIVRSYIENSMDKKEGLSKLYYIGPMFRGERPQKGRLRQFNQIGVEAIGPDTQNAYLDAEVIALSVKIVKELGVKDLELEVNTLGTMEDKKKFAKELEKALKKELSKVCDDCKSRFKRNIFRVLDCKNKSCQSVINKLELGDDWLSKESQEYFSNVTQALSDLGVKYRTNNRLVRGLDYYTQTVFEIKDPNVDNQQNTLGAGGRYDNLVSQLGGPKADAVGFALGIERILLARADKGETRSCDLDAFIIALDESSFKKAYLLLNALRNANVPSDISYRVSSVKSLMRQADKSGAGYVLILGEEEAKNDFVTVKDMKTGDQQQVQSPVKNISELLKMIKKGN